MYVRKPLDNMRRKIRPLPHQFDFPSPLKPPHPKITQSPTQTGLQRAVAALEMGSWRQVRCGNLPSPATQWTARTWDWRPADGAPRRPPAPAGLGETPGSHLPSMQAREQTEEKQQLCSHGSPGAGPRPLQGLVFTRSGAY